VKARAIRTRRLKKYKLTEADYQRLLETQGWACAICRGPPEAIDHDHHTGRVRGVLCTPCNQGIGHMFDEPKRLRAAADYLERATCK